jgi:hypothetical protein
MLRTRALALLVLALSMVPVMSCSKKDECSTCSTDSDCSGGTVCTRFSDDSQRCGSGLGATTCRVR